MLRANGIGTGYSPGLFVEDAPLSEESQKLLMDAVNTSPKLMNMLTGPAEISKYFRYADIAAVDCEATFWNDVLIPVARRYAGPPASKQLLEITPFWGPAFFDPDDPLRNEGQSKRLAGLKLSTVPGVDLTHVVIRVSMENEWGQKVFQYYYFNGLGGKARYTLLPHIRWDAYPLLSANSLKIGFSVWADQGSQVDVATQEVTNPNPNPRAATIWNQRHALVIKREQPYGEASERWYSHCRRVTCWNVGK